MLLVTPRAGPSRPVARALVATPPGVALLRAHAQAASVYLSVSRC